MSLMMVGRNTGRLENDTLQKKYIAAVIQFPASFSAAATSVHSTVWEVGGGRWEVVGLVGRRR